MAIVLLGGTISFSENEYDNRFIYDLIKQSRLIENYKIYDLFSGDSIDLYHNMFKLNEIVQKIISLKESRILVLVGTDRMIQIAKVFKKNIKNKTLILTGSMIPYRNRVETDSIFNFGFSMGSIMSIDSPDILIAMNGQLFDPDLVIKNYKTLRFEPIEK